MSSWAALAAVTVAALTLTLVAVAQGPVMDPYLEIPEGGGPVEVGDVPEGIDAVDAASCGECHEQHYLEWRRSAHRVAFTNAVFVHEYSRRESPFCARCHAPRPEVSSDGVDCAVCHVRNGAVLNPTVSGRAPHRSLATPELEGTLACARCHEFEFENQTDELLQRTVGEFAASAAAAEGESCQSCHMPGTERRHRHDMPGSRDTGMLERAIEVDAQARDTEEGTLLELTLRVDHAGHAVPTGDMFRHLEVRAWPLGRPDDAMSQSLRRAFRVDRDGWHEVADTRVPPTGERRVRFALPAARRVAWTIHLFYLPRRQVASAGLELREARRLVASGMARVQ